MNWSRAFFWLWIVVSVIWVATSAVNGMWAVHEVDGLTEVEVGDWTLQLPRTMTHDEAKAAVIAFIKEGPPGGHFSDRFDLGRDPASSAEEALRSWRTWSKSEALEKALVTGVLPPAILLAIGVAVRRVFRGFRRLSTR